jgi:hypothetical protein
LIFFEGKSQSTEHGHRFFIGSQGNYAILLRDDVATSKFTPGKGENTDYYLLKDSTGLHYMISITSSPMTQEKGISLYNELYEKDIKKRCNCEILKKDKTTFNNLEGVSFIIRAKLNEIPIKGISVSAISKNTLFVITFLSTPEKFESFMLEYRKAMNSLVLN